MAEEEKRKPTVNDLELSEEQEILDVVAENHDELLDDFNYPCGLQEPRVYKSVAPVTGQETAFFDFNDRGTAISEQMRDTLEPAMGLKEGFKALQEHEMGHWTGFPRNTTTRLYLIEANDRHFNGNESVYRFYSDIVDEMMVLESGRGERLVRMRETMIGNLQAEVDEMKQAGAPPGAVNGTEASITVHKLMCTLYSKSFADIETSVVLTPEEEVHMEKLLSSDTSNGKEGICFINTRQITEDAWENDLPRHEYSLIRFGKVLQDIIPEVEYKEGSGDGEGQPSNGYPQGRLKAMSGDHPGIKDIPTKEIDKALDDIIGKYGKKRFERIRDFVKRNRPDWNDSTAGGGRGGQQAGLGKGDFKLHDEEIPYFVRWASNYPCFIVKQPIKTDKTAIFRSGYSEFEAGDPMHKLDIVRSKGLIVPGVAQKYMEEEGRMPSKEFLVPNLMVGSDTSGSMPPPTKRAFHVLGEFILGENYHANGAKVGGYNFSTDIVFLAPTDDLFLYQSLMCGYWGGGTYLNIDRVKDFVAKMPQAEKDRFHFTTDEDWKRFADSMDPNERKKFEDKNLELDVGRLDFTTRETKLDHVMFTDGYIGNVEEVVNYISQMAQQVRNFLFLTNKDQYNEWREMVQKGKMPNTWVYLAERAEDYANLAMGLTENLVNDSVVNYGGHSSLNMDGGV